MKNHIKRFIKKILSYEIIRYGIGGGIALLIDLSILYILTEFLGVWYMLSAIIAFSISFIFSFLFQKYITFRDNSKQHLKQGGLFLAFQLIGQGIYMVVLRFGVDVRGFYYMFVAIIGKGIAFIWNYLSNHYFNFKN